MSPLGTDRLSPTAGTKTAVGTPPYSTERETEAEDQARASSPTSDGKEGLRPASNPRLRRPESGARASARPALPARSWNWAGRRNQGPRRGTAAALPAAPGRGGPGQGHLPGCVLALPSGRGRGRGGGGPEDGAEEDARAARPRPGAPSLPVPAPRGRATLPSSPPPLPRPSAGSRPPPPPDAHAPPDIPARPGRRGHLPCRSCRCGGAAGRRVAVPGEPAPREPRAPAPARPAPSPARSPAAPDRRSPQPGDRPPPAAEVRSAPPAPPRASRRGEGDRREGLACRRGLRDPGVASPASPRLAPGHCEPSPGPQRSLPSSLARALPPSPAPPAASLRRSLSSLLTSVCPEAGQSRGRAPGGSKLRQGSWAAAAGGALRGPLGWGWNPGWHLEALAHCPAQPGTQATAGQLAAGTPASLSLTGGEEVPQEARQCDTCVCLYVWGCPTMSRGLLANASAGPQEHWPSAQRCPPTVSGAAWQGPGPCLSLASGLLRKRGSEEEMRPAPASGFRLWAAEEGGALGQSRVQQRFPGMRGCGAVCFGSMSALSSPSLPLGPPTVGPSSAHSLPAAPRGSALRPLPPDLAEAGPSPGLSFPRGRASRALAPPLRRGLAAPPALGDRTTPREQGARGVTSRLAGNCSGASAAGLRAAPAGHRSSLGFALPKELASALGEAGPSPYPENKHRVSTRPPPIINLVMAGWPASRGVIAAPEPRDWYVPLRASEAQEK
ncbi:collagen alpha-1(I) chain-like [Cervus elaphus]|uniref:collagen alpha-1(I) chain-like n=1 Tax=Cervus elaphus TaxID=9860 RepID=UPI001CC2B4C4|nr:collagen alpha-1(I) chain-like [Cervus elaphus]